MASFAPQGTPYRPQGTWLRPQGTSRVPIGALPAPSWVPRDSAGVPMSWYFDFVNGRYWPTSYTSYLTGTLTVSASGLAIGPAIDITGTAGLVNMLNDQSFTVFSEISGGISLSANIPVLAFSSTDAPLFVVFTSGVCWSFHTNLAGSAATLDRYGRYLTTRRLCASQNASGRTICQNGAPIATIASLHSTPTAIQLGKLLPSSYSNAGFIRSIGGWKNYKVANADQVALTLPLYSPVAMPPGKSFALRGYYNTACNLGNNKLQYEYTQAWSMFTEHALVAIPDLSGNSLAAVLHTNVTAASVFPGWETFILPLSSTVAVLCLRIINDVTTHMISVYGSTNLYDGQFHRLGSSYAGGGLASGVALYVDGVPETLTVQQDNLGGNSIISGTQTLVVGNQTNRLGYYDMGFQTTMQLSNIVRSAGYFSTYAAAGSTPPLDANNTFAFDYSGATTTITDLTGNGNNGTITNLNLRYSA